MIWPASKPNVRPRSSVSSRWMLGGSLTGCAGSPCVRQLLTVAGFPSCIVPIEPSADRRGLRREFEGCVRAPFPGYLARAARNERAEAGFQHRQRPRSRSGSPDRPDPTPPLLMTALSPLVIATYVVRSINGDRPGFGITGGWVNQTAYRTEPLRCSLLADHRRTVAHRCWSVPDEEPRDHPRPFEL